MSTSSWLWPCRAISSTHKCPVPLRRRTDVRRLFVVRTACSALSAAGHHLWADSPFAAFFAAEQTNRLKLTPTKFELSDDEREYWQALQEAQVG